MVILTSYGVVSSCPVCLSAIWINTNWPGLPRWAIPSPGNKSDPFKCPWCDSIVLMQKTNENSEHVDLVVVNRGKEMRDVQLSYPIIMQKESIILLMQNLLKTMVSPQGKGKDLDTFSINLKYRDKNEMIRDLDERIASVISIHKVLPIPVLLP